MLEIVIPGMETLRLDHLVADFNGTLAVDGELLPDVMEALSSLRAKLDIPHSDGGRSPYESISSTLNMPVRSNRQGPNDGILEADQVANVNRFAAAGRC